MPDPREEAVARELWEQRRREMDSMELWNGHCMTAARSILAAADAVDPYRLVQPDGRSLSQVLVEEMALRARLAEAEHDVETSTAAVARLHELLADAVVRAETAEAERREAHLRLADVASVLRSAHVDEDTGELVEDASGLLSALDHALEGSSGCVEPEEFEAHREQALREHGEDLGLAAVKGREDA